MAGQNFAIIMLHSPKNKIKLSRKVVISHRLRHGDTLRVTTADQSTWRIRLEEKAGDLWFGEGWDAVHETYGIKTNNLVVFVKTRGRIFYSMHHYGVNSVEAGIPGRPDETLPFSFFRPFHTGEQLRKLSLPAKFKELFLQELGNKICCRHEEGETTCDWRLESNKIQVTIGWKMVVEHVSLKVGDIALFSYGGCGRMTMTVCRSEDGEIVVTEDIVGDGETVVTEEQAGDGETVVIEELSGDEETAVMEEVAVDGDAMDAVGNAMDVNGDAMDIDGGETLLWSSTLSKAMATGEQCYYIPVGAVELLSKITHPKVKIMTEDGEIQEWTVISREGGHRDIRFGAGWYKYAMHAGLAEGDNIRFYTTNNDEVLKVKVIRNVA